MPILSNYVLISTEIGLEKINFVLVSVLNLFLSKIFTNKIVDVNQISKILSLKISLNPRLKI